MSRLSLDSCLCINTKSQTKKYLTTDSPLSPSIELFHSPSFSFRHISIRYWSYAIFYLTLRNELGIVCHCLEPFLVSFNSTRQTDKPLGRRNTHCGNFLRPSRNFWLSCMFSNCSDTHHPAHEGLNNSPASLIRCVKAEHKVWVSML